MGSSFTKAAAIRGSATNLLKSSTLPTSALISNPLVGQLVRTVQTVVGTVKEKRGGSVLVAGDDVEPITKVLDQIYPEKLGMVTPIYQHIRPTTDVPTDIRYINICEEMDWHIGIFVLPPNSRIPLHDHPGMCVLSRLLCGSLHVRSFDWCSSGGVRGMRSARLLLDEWYKEPRTLSLFSKAGNVHEFVAGEEGCAILDVLVPPYDPLHGRPCNYYKAVGPLKKESPKRENSVDADGQTDGEAADEQEVYRLVAIDDPEDLEVINGEYAGPAPEGTTRRA